MLDVFSKKIEAKEMSNIELKNTIFYFLENSNNREDVENIASFVMKCCSFDDPEDKKRFENIVHEKLGQVVDLNEIARQGWQQQQPQNQEQQNQEELLNKLALFFNMMQCRQNEAQFN